MAKRVEDYTDEDRQAIRDLEVAMGAIRKAVGGKAGEGFEKKYADVYKKCYRLGLKDYKLKVY